MDFYNEDDIRRAAENASSVSGVMRNLGLSPSGANHRIFKRRLISLNIKFGGMDKRKYTRFSNRLLEDYLVENGPSISSNELKGKLFKAGLKQPICEECGLAGEWNGRPLVHHLDHKDGNYYNNKIENLQILCPNCHSQTDTYCNRSNDGVYSKRFRPDQLVEVCCRNCPDRFSRSYGSKRTVCPKCRLEGIELKISELCSNSGVTVEDIVSCLESRGLHPAATLIDMPGVTLKRWMSEGLFQNRLRDGSRWKSKIL